MDIERFRTLADTHGSDLARWPVADRETARALVKTSGVFAETLTNAAQLDELLDGWIAPAPTASLRERVLATAPSPRGLAPRKVWRGGLGFWLSGAGVATAGLVGVLCGAAISTAALAEARDEALVVSATTDGAAGLTDEARQAPSFGERRPAT